MAKFVLVLILFLSSAFGASRKEYLDFIKRAVEKSWADYPELIERWKSSGTSYILWGYNLPGELVYLADALGFLYQITGEKNYAIRAIKILYEFFELRKFFPSELAMSRIEYKEGVPAIPNFFFVYPYVRVRVKGSGLLTDDMNKRFSDDIIQSINFISYLPEWGAHNRAVLRAVSYLLGSIAFQTHFSAGEWRRQAEVLIYDNLGKWEAEDATLYGGVWLHGLLIFIENYSNDKILNNYVFKYYFDYYLNLITPFGTMVDIGDSNFNIEFERFIPCFEKAASFYKDGKYKYAADRIFRRLINDGKLSAHLASILSDAYRWCDDKIEIEIPSAGSQEILDDIVGKKIVFGTGWDSLSTYLLLNYRDEGEGHFITKEYLRNTISVEEEKMHHGSSDENSIIFLMTKGSILLHHAGYRDGLPSGMFGAYRADYFHNRLIVRKNKREVRNNPVFISPVPGQHQKSKRFLNLLEIPEVTEVCEL